MRETISLLEGAKLIGYAVGAFVVVCGLGYGFYRLYEKWFGKKRDLAREREEDEEIKRMFDEEYEKLVRRKSGLGDLSNKV